MRNKQMCAWNVSAHRTATITTLWFSNFLVSNSQAVQEECTRGAQTAQTYHLNSINGVLRSKQDLRGEVVLKNEISMYLSPTSPLLSLACCKTLHYKPVACSKPIERFLQEHLLSSSSQNGFRPWYFFVGHLRFPPGNGPYTAFKGSCD